MNGLWKRRVEEFYFVDFARKRKKKRKIKLCKYSSNQRKSRLISKNLKLYSIQN